jgi:hypothetical protein
VIDESIDDERLVARFQGVDHGSAGWFDVVWAMIARNQAVVRACSANPTVSTLAHARRKKKPLREKITAQASDGGDR